MHARKLQVTNGRLVLDEVIDLPDGAEEEVVVIGDELSAEKRAALHASLDRALDDSEASRPQGSRAHCCIHRPWESGPNAFHLDEARRRHHSKPSAHA